MTRSLPGRAAAILEAPRRPARRSGELRLRKTDVDLWRASLDESPGEVVDRLKSLLSPDEQDRAHRFYFERDRRRFVVGRGVLRVLLGSYLSCPPSDLVFRYGANGKPELDHAFAADPLQFNLAHSEGLAVFAFTRVGPVGIDIERIRDLPDWEYIASSCFSSSDRRRLEQAPPELRREEFFQAWTRQEAVLKATGLGLGAAPLSREVAARCDASNPPCGPGLSGDTGRLAVRPVVVAPGYAAALAIGDGARWVTCHTWHPLPILSRPPAGRRTRRLPLSSATSSRIDFV